MKLLRYGPAHQEKPGLLDANGKIRDLSAHLSDVDSRAIDAEGLKRLSLLNIDSIPIVEGSPRLGVPLSGIGKVVAIGLNYVDHANEAKLPIPSEPIVFMKATSSLCGSSDDTLIPRNSTKLDWEVELGIVVGTRASYVNEEDALDHVAGYLAANDVSERQFQLERGSQWDKGKGCDTFCPLGPYLVTKDEIKDPQNLAMWLDVNGERMQSGNTANMIFSCAKIVSYLSQFMTLLPGDVIITGTPHGVGIGFNPPRFLKAGDVVTLGIDGLGSQRQLICDTPADGALS
jgi:2,4-diketo-3-deoxy-L-fuconate hydrolase